jgi:guanine nucleotide-binding protein G(i) subunit alpha
VSENLLLKGGEVYTEDIHKCVVSLWKESVFKESLAACRTEYHIFDGAEYFFDDLDRLKPPKYIPNTQDALRCRRKTTGVIEFTCYPQIEGKGTVAFKLVDVGGQRNERKKWPQFYEGITALMFVVSLNEYDQKCYEDDTTNRMVESIDLFDENTNGPFKQRPVILFLNKIDLFKEKIQRSPLSNTFSDYTGGGDFEKGIDFIRNKFLSTNKFEPGRIHPFVTCATDKETVQKSFDDILKLVKDGLLEIKN